MLFSAGLRGIRDIAKVAILKLIGYLFSVAQALLVDANPHCYMPTASQQGFIFLPLNCQLFTVSELFDIELYSSK